MYGGEDHDYVGIDPLFQNKNSSNNDLVCNREDQDEGDEPDGEEYEEYKEEQYEQINHQDYKEETREKQKRDKGDNRDKGEKGNKGDKQKREKRGKEKTDDNAVSFLFSDNFSSYDSYLREAISSNSSGSQVDITGRDGRSIGEKICCKTLEEIYGVEFKTTRPKFLINPESGRRLELDCYNEKLKIAVEYNGVQHYKFPNFIHKNYEEFEKQVKRDKLKYDLCEKEGVYLITVPYTCPYDKISDYIKYYLPEEVIKRSEEERYVSIVPLEDGNGDEDEDEEERKISVSTIHSITSISDITSSRRKENKRIEEKEKVRKKEIKND
jgi:hypothetical protein